MSLGVYTKGELHKIVDIYNLGLKVKDLNAAKKDLVKEMEKVGMKKFKDLPSKSQLKDHEKKPLDTIAKGTKDISSSFGKKAKGKVRPLTKEEKEKDKKPTRIRASKTQKEKIIKDLTEKLGRKPSKFERDMAVSKFVANLEGRAGLRKPKPKKK